MIISKLDAFLIGKPKPFAPNGVASTMAREPVDGPVRLGLLGFDGDQVADTSVHGGHDKAVHFYPAEHYQSWQADFVGGEAGVHPLLEMKGAFGENLSARGMQEDRVYIGDRFRIGGALVEISQGRQPCWKLDHRFGIGNMAKSVIRSGRCGYYFRVIEEGMVAPGDGIQQIARAQYDWTVAETFYLLIGGGHRALGAKNALADLAKLETLEAGWRARAAALGGA